MGLLTPNPQEDRTTLLWFWVGKITAGGIKQHSRREIKSFTVQSINYDPNLDHAYVDFVLVFKTSKTGRCQDWRPRWLLPRLRSSLLPSYPKTNPRRPLATVVARFFVERNWFFQALWHWYLEALVSWGIGVINSYLQEANVRNFRHSYSVCHHCPGDAYEPSNRALCLNFGTDTVISLAIKWKHQIVVICEARKFSGCNK